jgi:diaminopimelate decarboxylase
MAEPAPVSEAAPPDGPAAGPWPAAAAFGAEGLTIGGLAAEELAARFGTPLVVIDVDDVRTRMRAAGRAFSRVAYAVKAFTAHPMIRLALEEGLDLLCASGGELEACLRAGAPGERLLLHGNAKTDHELELAVAAGVGLLIADGAHELERLDAVARAMGRVQPVLLRVIPEVEVDTHEAIATGHELSKFGTPRAEATEAAVYATALPGIRLDGFHAHAGSQVLDVVPYLRVLDTLLDLSADVERAVGLRAEVLDVGGGFGVTYVDETPLGLGAVADAMLARLRERVRFERGPAPTLLVEPGRALVANAGCTLYRVVGRKRVGGRTLVAVDGGMSDNLRPMLYDARFTVASASASASASATAARPVERVTLVGRHCESGDVLVADAALPAATDVGDLVALAATGAYTYSLASAYNRIGRPAVVAVDRGAVTPWLRREDPADLDRLEVGAARVDAEATEPPPGVEVRPARPRDARSFAAMWRDVVAEGRWVRTEHADRSTGSYRRRFRRSWSSEGAELVAVGDGRVVGQLGVSRERHPATRHVATLGMAVAADRRGLGVGSALLAAAIRWARVVGVRRLVLSVYPSNASAIALYRKFGFVEEGRLSRQSRKAYGYEDEILMARWVGEDE